MVTFGFGNGKIYKMRGLIDSHFHLDHYRNYNDLISTINKIQQYTICVTNSPGVFYTCKNQLSESKYLKHAIGFHPQEGTLTEKDLSDFLKLMEKTNYIGEIGLDFKCENGLNKEFQLESFKIIVAKCAKDNKLMTVHIKKAEKEALDIISRYTPKKCIIHWYTGSEEDLTKFVKAGCYFSINANMIQSKYSNKYKQIPINRILIESDGPYTKINGKTFSPELLMESYRQIAQFYNEPNLVQKVFENFRAILTVC